MSSLFPKIKRFYLPIILASIAAIAVAACNPSNFKSSAAQVPQLVSSILSDPQTFNYPLNQDASTTSLLGLLFDGLTTQNPITGKFEPSLAESWKIL